MITGPIVAEIAALLADPARATMVWALLDGGALTAGELAGAARITPQTASTHLAKLTEAGLLSMTRQGRHRRFRFASFDGARLREADLSGVRASGAALRGLDLSGAVLHRAELEGADLRGSDLSSLDPRTAELQGAIVDVDQTIALAQALGLDVRADETQER